MVRAAGHKVWACPRGCHLFTNSSTMGGGRAFANAMATFRRLDDECRGVVRPSVAKVGQRRPKTVRPPGQRQAERERHQRELARFVAAAEDREAQRRAMAEAERRRVVEARVIAESDRRRREIESLMRPGRGW